jgi:hypothetical protein
MELRIEHEIAAPLASVEAAVLGGDLLPRLPTYASVIASAVERTRRARGDLVEREAVYLAAFVPQPLAAVVPRAWATWVERTCWDRRTHAATFSIEPQIPRPLRRLVACAGRYALLSITADRTLRRISGELRIDAPGLGRLAEAALVRIVARQFAGEAALLAALARGAA